MRALDGEGAGRVVADVGGAGGIMALIGVLGCDSPGVGASHRPAIGGKVAMTTGDYSNIKITTPEDIAIAEVLLRQAKGDN